MCLKITQRVLPYLNKYISNIGNRLCFMLCFTCNQIQLPKSFKGSERYFAGNLLGGNSGGVGGL